MHPAIVQNDVPIVDQTHLEKLQAILYLLLSILLLVFVSKFLGIACRFCF